MNREAALLDDLEDAREEHDRTMRQFRFGLLLLISGILLTILTTAVLSYLNALYVDLGGAGLINALFGSMAIAGGVVTGVTWFEDLPKTRKALKRAQRAHRNHTLRNT